MKALLLLCSLFVCCVTSVYSKYSFNLNFEQLCDPNFPEKTDCTLDWQIKTIAAFKKLSPSKVKAKIKELIEKPGVASKRALFLMLLMHPPTNCNIKTYDHCNDYEQEYLREIDGLLARDVYNNHAKGLEKQTSLSAVQVKKLTIYYKYMVENPEETLFPEQDFVFSALFPIFGTTGSGKSTLINQLLAQKEEDLEASDRAKAAVRSVTTNIELKESGFFCYEKNCEKDDCLINRHKASGCTGSKAEFKFFDTPGFGAEDRNAEKDIRNITVQIGVEGKDINGFIFVHKAERFRTGFLKEMGLIKTMIHFFKGNLDKKPHERIMEEDKFGKNCLIIITHTGHLNRKTQRVYTDQVAEQFDLHGFEIPKSNILHVNFALWDELDDDHKRIYRKRYRSEKWKIMKKLLSFTDPINVNEWQRERLVQEVDAFGKSDQSSSWSRV